MNSKAKMRWPDLDEAMITSKTPLLLFDQSSMADDKSTPQLSSPTTVAIPVSVPISANKSTPNGNTQSDYGCINISLNDQDDEMQSAYRRNISLTKREPFESIVPVKQHEQQTQGKQQQDSTATFSSMGTIETTIASIESNNGASSPDSLISNDTSWSIFKGIFFSFISSIFFSLTTVIVKYLSDIHPGQMAVCRFTGILLFSFPMAISCKSNPFGPRNLRHFLLLRGIAGASSLYFRYLSLQYIPIANATVIVLSMPIFVCVLARIFLKEAFGLFHFIALTVTLLGISCTSKLNIIFGSNDSDAEANGYNRRDELFGLLSGMGATLVGSFAYIIVRKVKGINHSVIMFNFAWVALLETSVLTYLFKGFKLPDCGFAPWLLMILAVLSFYGQWLLTRALQAEEAGLVSVIRASSEVFFAFLFQIVIFKQLPDIYSITGAVLVTSAVVLTSIRKWITTLDSNHWAKKIFAFTLK